MVELINYYRSVDVLLFHTVTRLEKAETFLSLSLSLSIVVENSPVLVCYRFLVAICIWYPWIFLESEAKNFSVVCYTQRRLIVIDARTERKVNSDPTISPPILIFWSIILPFSLL